MSGSMILEGMQEAVAFAKGEKNEVKVTKVSIPNDVDVKAIRVKTGLTQEEFAKVFAFSLSSVKNWEQNHRRPTGPARTLLALIERHPMDVMRQLKEIGA